MLARYAAFFCDRVLVPLRFGVDVAHTNTQKQREQLIRDIIRILELRPLIDRGIVSLIPSEIHYCTTCFQKLLPSGDRIAQLVDKMIDENIDRFSVRYDPRPHSKNCIGQLVLRGPEDLVGPNFFEFPLRRVPDWLPEAKDGVPVRKLSTEALRRSDLVSGIFQEIAMDISVQQVFGLRFNARYLTNRAAEAEFLSRLSTADLFAARTAKLCAQLTHSVPLFAEIPLDRVMKIREQDFDAFLSYRATLNQILKQHVEEGHELTESEARDLYTDLLEPQVLNLKQQAQNERKSALEKASFKIGITSALVGIGVFSGLLPSQLAELCKAVGGVALARDMAEAFGAIEKYPTKIRNNNLYFLLRLTEEAD